MDISPDGLYLAAGASEGRVWIWHIATGRPLLTCEGHNSRVRCVCYSPDGRLLASLDSFGTVRLWDIAAALAAGSDQVVKTLGEFSSQSWLVCFSPDSTTLAGTFSDQSVWQCDVTNALALDAG